MVSLPYFLLSLSFDIIWPGKIISFRSRREGEPPQERDRQRAGKKPNNMNAEFREV
jgi:hypothetical protein